MEATVIRPDKRGRVYNFALNLGKKVVDLYAEDLTDAITELPDDFIEGDVEFNAKSAGKHVFDKANDQFVSSETAVETISSLIQKDKKLKVAATYTYYGLPGLDVTSSAAEATVYIASVGREVFYEGAQKNDDKTYGLTKEGYSTKADTDDGIGYYYKQKNVKMGDTDYYRIDVKPMYK